MTFCLGTPGLWTIPTIDCKLPEVNQESAQIVQLGGNVWPLRQKRSTDFGFPQTIQLKLTINGNEEVDIVMGRRYLPFVPSINGKSQTNSLQHHATYQNPNEGAAITVRCRDRTTRPCQLYGTFSHESQFYQIQALGYGEDYLHEIVRLDLENRSFLGLQNHVPMKTTKNRRKRYAGGANIKTKYVAEMLLWIDYLIYTRFLETAGNDATEADLNIQTFAIGVMNEVDTRARNLQKQALEMGISNAADFDLSVMLTELVVCKTDSFCVWSEDPSYNINGVLQTNALLAFIATLILYKKTNYDFAVGLTGYEVLDDRHSDTNCGVYFLDNQMCVAENLTYVSSIAKATEGGVGFNVAHFLGRHMGMIGDVTETSCAEDNYLSSSDWSPGTSDKASHPFHWSNCTIERIYTSSQTSGKNDCLLVNSFVNDTYLAYHSALEPGRELEADIQCKYEFGSTSTFCGTQDASICYTGISCTNPDTNICENVALPLDGTACHELAQPLPKKLSYTGTRV
ncbi:A disintegrin and metalloproteinase with thrombospondin motifs 18-like [Mizuhopecten yessoensis]|uniref:A disintegrin and metalloproteinase with thrombospondin motifs 18-like n=1 Tax=Mizuhopecten yessoensis TaxID=6573 RepID=UPI000B45986E|nr:A disintegrin and metalloproteinase with thrombospondin motifs 18-like [Mizuhopecten yessoensis]